MSGNSPATANPLESDAKTTASNALDVDALRADFPILSREIHGKTLAYLDNAATSQKPSAVLDTLRDYYELTNANVHRGVHLLSVEATDEYEAARKKIAAFIGARGADEIIFTRGTTEAINLVASCYGRKHLTSGDEIVITTMEHHSNIVPWQMLSEETGAILRVAPINEAGEIPLEDYNALLGPRTKIVALAHVSNALGTINPVREMIALAHEHDAIVLLDGAQAVPHIKVDVQELGCDFYAFSAHKMFGPTGIGALYGKLSLLEDMPPYQGGGDMIESVSFEKTIYAQVPHKFEAGTPNIAGAIGMGAAVDYMNGIGHSALEAYETELLQYGTERLLTVPGLRLIGTAAQKAGVLSFVLDKVHPHDIGTIVDQDGIAIRTGHHCAQPVMDRYGLAATARASIAFYNTREEIDRLVESLNGVLEMFS